MKTIPAGISRYRDRGWREWVTIRHEPETVFELSDLAKSLSSNQHWYLGQCPCCGSPVAGQYMGGGLMGGLLGSILG